MNTTVSMNVIYSPSEINVYTIDRFIFIEGIKTEGVKGENYTKHTFKTCMKIPKNIDMTNLKVLYGSNVIKITSDCNYSQECELTISKGYK